MQQVHPDPPRIPGQDERCKQTRPQTGRRADREDPKGGHRSLAGHGGRRVQAVARAVGQALGAGTEQGLAPTLPFPRSRRKALAGV